MNATRGMARPPRSQHAPEIPGGGAVGAGFAPSNASDLAVMFGLNLSAGRRLVCRWHRGTDGHIACHWELDAVPWR
jgi:hypothetical protein